MNTPATCPITKTPSWTAQENTNNNTPVNTEVLWGGGELLTRSPSIDDRRQIVHADEAVAICEAIAWGEGAAHAGTFHVEAEGLGWAA